MLKFRNFISDKPGKILIERDKFNDMKNCKQSLKVSKPDVQQGAPSLGVFVKNNFSFKQLWKVGPTRLSYRRHITK